MPRTDSSSMLTPCGGSSRSSNSFTPLLGRIPIGDDSKCILHSHCSHILQKLIHMNPRVLQLRFSGGQTYFTRPDAAIQVSQCRHRRSRSVGFAEEPDSEKAIA